MDADLWLKIVSLLQEDTQDNGGFGWIYEEDSVLVNPLIINNMNDNDTAKQSNPETDGVRFGVCQHDHKGTTSVRTRMVILNEG